MLKRHIHIKGTGKFIPQREVLSTDLDHKFSKTKGWTENKSGVYKRHFASPEETTSFMAVQAANQALKEAGINHTDIDCIVGACGVMEQSIPTTSVLVQRLLGLEDSGITTFDVNSTCLSFLSALDNASYMISAGRFQHTLIFSSDIPSLGINWDHIEGSSIFGDGAAAVILSQPTPQKCTTILSSRTETYSIGSSYCQVQAGGTRLHPSQFNGNLAEYAFFEMNGKAAYKLTVEKIDSFLKTLLSEAGLDLADIDWVIPHQASKLAMHHLWKKLCIPEGKLVDIFSIHGNQVAASMPTALHEAFTKGYISRGDRILLIGTGAGISLGGMVLEYNQ